MVHAQPLGQSWPFRCLSSLRLSLWAGVRFQTDEGNQLCDKGSGVTAWEVPFSNSRFLFFLVALPAVVHHPAHSSCFREAPQSPGHMEQRAAVDDISP